jgi:four helix bundle protein
MILQLSHTKLDLFQHTKEFVLQCYRISDKLPDRERYSMSQQIRRAALSVHLNLAEGCSRKSNAERMRFMEIARSSLVEVDAALDIAQSLKYVQPEDMTDLEPIMWKAFKGLSGLISNYQSNKNQAAE